MAIDVAAVLQKLKDNKTRRADTHGKGTYAQVAEKARTRVCKHKTRKLGKFVGVCPRCQIALGNDEVDHYDGPTDDEYRCSRCGEELPHADDLKKEVSIPMLTVWRRHDKWGNCMIPAPVHRAEKSVGYAFPVHHVL